MKNILFLKVGWLLLGLLWFSSPGFGQGCSCPTITSCGPCTGGLTTLTFKFNGAATSLIQASDNSGTLFSANLNPGDQFTISGTLPNGRFQGSTITIKINGVNNALVATSCGTGVFIGSVFGSFSVTAGASATGGPLCCADALVEKIAPQIMNCPSNMEVVITSGCSTSVTWTAPTATDNCGVLSLVTTNAPGSLFSVGSTIVQYTATDVYGNTSQCSFLVTVVDPSPPVITNCPATVQLKLGTSGCSVLGSWTPPTVTDNCSVASLTSSHQPGSQFPLGTTSVTYTATDTQGNVATCSFNVVVADDVAPTIAGCPSGISVSANTSCQAVVTWPVPTATDNCGSATLTSTHNPESVFALGTTVVTYTAKDDFGNTSTCSFNVVVTDASPPVLAGCPANITVNATNCSGAATWLPPTALDNCSAITITSNYQPGDTFPAGTTFVEYAAADSKGNISKCNFTVTVKDQVPPVFASCVANINLSIGTSCETPVTWVAPTATDNCGPVVVTSNYSPGAVLPIGTTQVTYTASDNSGNTASCSFFVVINNETMPSITDCPEKISVKAERIDEMVAVQWIEPTVSSPCDYIQVTKSHTPGSQFPVGTTTVTYSAIDAKGAAASCSFDVEVVYNPQDIEPAKFLTPDGNGLNDVWIIKDIEKFPDNQVTVIDRWGGLVFKSARYDNSTVVWDGRNNGGGQSPTGTYFYEVVVALPGGKVKRTGSIELIR